MSSDSELIQNTLAGKRDAFRELVNKYESLVAATVKGMLGECPEAEDVGQDTFIRFYMSLRKFRGESTVSTYLTRIAINLSLNELKRRRRKQLRMARLSDEVKETDEIPAQNEVIAAVRDAIEALEPKFRAVIVLRFIQGYSVKETAAILKLPSGTVMSRLARAQRKMGRILSYLDEQNGK